MHYRDHAPPHFHAHYGEYSGIIDIETLMVLRCHLPRRAEAMVREWASQHQDELRENWRLAQAKIPLAPIAPLE